MSDLLPGLLGTLLVGHIVAFADPLTACSVMTTCGSCTENRSAAGSRPLEVGRDTLVILSTSTSGRRTPHVCTRGGTCGMRGGLERAPYIWREEPSDFAFCIFTMLSPSTKETWQRIETIASHYG